MVKVIVDGYGGDNAPEVVVQGCLLAVQNNKDLHIVITGDENKIKEILSGYSYNPENFTIVHTTQVVDINASPSVEFKTKPDSSLVKAYEILRTQEDVVGLVSAGSTGAILVGAFLKLGRIKGVSRPALCPVLPTSDGKFFLLCDSGANVDCKPINLVHFAIMANEYAKHVFKIKKPTVGLLNIGAEEEKGNEQTREAYQLLKSVPKLKFIGNVEGTGLMAHACDIVVADGFVGNAVLKASEGTMKAFNVMLKTEIKKRFLSKIGYLFMKKSFKNFRDNINKYSHQGAVLIGCKKLVVKAHGNSNAKTISNAIGQVVDMSKENLCEVIEKEVSKYSKSTE